MKHMLILLAALIIGPSYCEAASCTVDQSITINSNFETVTDKCKEYKDQLFEESGIKILSKVDENTFLCEVRNNRFVIKEEREESADRVVVKRTLVKSSGRLTEYISETTFSRQGNETLISNHISMSIAGIIGPKIMEKEIRAGINKMIVALKTLL